MLFALQRTVPKPVMLHWFIGSVRIWAELDSFQGGMQEFWLLGEHTKWTQTILDTRITYTVNKVP